MKKNVLPLCTGKAVPSPGPRCAKFIPVELLCSLLCFYVFLLETRKAGKCEVPHMNTLICGNMIYNSYSLIWHFTKPNRKFTHQCPFHFFFRLQVLSSLSNPFYRTERDSLTRLEFGGWGGVGWGVFVLKERARANLGLVVIIWASLWDRVSPSHSLW